MLPWASASCSNTWAPPACTPGRAHDLPQAHAAAAALLEYAQHTQGRPLTHIHSVQGAARR